MISRVFRRSKHLRHTAVAAAAPAMISRVIRRSKHLRHTAVAAAAPAMISRVIRRSSQPHAPSLALSGARGTTAAAVQRRRNINTAVAIMATVPTRVRSISTDAAPMVAVGYGATFPQQQPGPRPFSSLGWEQRYACRDGPPVNGLANSRSQGQAQRVVEMDCHGGPVSKVSRPPETTASLARGGPPLQARHQRRPQLSSGTLSPPVEMPMFSQSVGPQQSAPTAVTLAAAVPVAEAVTGARVFPAVSSKGVAEAPASSAGAALAAAPETGGTVLFSASVGGAPASSAVAATSAEISAAEPTTSGNAPRPHQLGGQSGRASRPLELCHRTRQRRWHHRSTVLLPLRQRRGRLERSRQQLGPMAKSAARGGRPPTPSIPVPCVRWRSTTTTAAGCSMAVAAAAAAAATTTPVTTTPGGM